MRLVPTPSRPGRRSRRLVVAVAVLFACAVPAAVAMRPVPLDWKHTVGDPSVVKTAKNYVVIATGAKVNRALSKNGKVWKWKSSALPVLPAWAKPNGGDIWAADMEEVGSKYVLYYSAPVKGKTGTSRCIGVATSSKANGAFTPVGTAPLVCPNSTWFSTVPTAADRIVDKSALDAYASTSAEAQRKYDACQASLASSPTPSTPADSATSEPTVSDSASATASVSASESASASTSASASASSSPTTRPTCKPTKVTAPTTATNVIGAIDPSFFLDNDGAPYLLYKTDGIPSSIRILPLSSDGLSPASIDTVSQTLVADASVLENPVMVNRGGIYYLFNSYGDYAGCNYSTVWRASASLRDWSASPVRTLLNRKNTHKLCGPGGADVLVQPKKVTMYFEAWTCNRSYKPCPKNLRAYSSAYAHKHPVRALYAVKLGFRDGAPYLKKYVKGSKR